MRFCPFAHRAVLALIAKNVDYEVININLVDKPDWFFARSYFSKVPSLEIEDGVTIVESLVIAQYLDDVYPQRPLVAKDPVTKAFDQIIVESSAQIHSFVYRLLRKDTVTDDIVRSFFNALNLIQSHLKKRGTKFLGGDQPGYADYMIWPWFERLPSYSDERTNLDTQKYKLLLDYIKNMKEDPVVKEYALPVEAFHEYHRTYTLGAKPTYNLLLE